MSQFVQILVGWSDLASQTNLPRICASSTFRVTRPRWTSNSPCRVLFTPIIVFIPSLLLQWHQAQLTLLRQRNQRGQHFSHFSLLISVNGAFEQTLPDKNLNNFLTFFLLLFQILIFGEFLTLNSL